MKKIYRLLLMLVLLFIVDNATAQCTHTIELTDTYGDGWNGGAVSVSVNGTVVLTNITLGGGFGPASFNFTASAGQTIRVYTSINGSWISERRIRVVNNTGVEVIALISVANGTSTTGGRTGIANCAAPVSITPPVCYDMNGNTGGFSNGLGGNSWNSGATTTPSTGTGPQGADASGGSGFAFTESSGIYNTTYGMTGYFDLSAGNYQMTFDYHMYGTSMGNLRVLVNGAQVFIASGNLGNIWNSTVIDLSGYTGTSVGIAILSTTGTSYTSDCAIDNVCINTPGLVSGCMNPASANYDPLAVVDDGSCYFAVPQTGSNSITECTGSLYDNGGPTANYANGSNGYTVLYPSAGNSMQLTGTHACENNWDYLYIYDGVGITGTLLYSSAGTGSGTVNIGTITSLSGPLTVQFTSDASMTYAGFDLSLACVTPPPPPSDYTHSIVGINGEYVGDCLVSDCGPFTYADNGDNGSDYSTNINQIYRVFCPEVASNCMEITFNSFETETNYDYLQIKNGPTQNSTQIVSLTGDLSTSLPLTYTSTDASGCLTFRFNSDGSITDAGWDATLQCVPCAGGPSGVDNNDCANLMPLCSGTSVAGNSTGPGIKAEGCTGNACPAGGENHTNWYSFTAFSTGTLTLTMTPNVPTDDYDFAIYGPNTTCASLGSPIRCTDAGVTGATGLTGAAADNTEDVNGDSFLQTMNVTAGESYIIVIDEWSPNTGGGYLLEFGGTASLDCGLLPVELTEFGAEYAPDLDIVDVFWTTASEENNDRFELERSANGEDYERIHTIDAVGNSIMESKYYTIDTDPLAGMNYYRLKQVDIEGSYEYSKVVAVNLLDDAYDIISIAPNPTNSLTEIVFNCYSKEEAVLVIYDSQGSLINRKSLSCVPGGNRVTIDLSNNRNGLYMISLSTSNKTYSSKILKN